jgi:hypothetical protein
MNVLTVHTQNSQQNPSRRPTHSTPAAILVVASLGVAVLAACGSNSTTASSSTSTGTASSATSSAAATTASAAALPDAAKIVGESAKTTQTLQYVHLALAATGLAKFPVSSVNADVTNQPVGNGQAVGDAKFRVTPQAPFVDTQFLVTEKTFYTKSSDGTYKAVGPSQKIYDPAILLDKDKGLANVIRSMKDPTVEERETVDGVATVKVSGTIDASVIDPLAPSLGDGGGTLPITVWIADVVKPGTPPPSLPSDAPSPGTGPNLVKMSVQKDQGSVELNLSAWAKPVEIPKP